MKKFGDFWFPTGLALITLACVAYFQLWLPSRQSGAEKWLRRHSPYVSNVKILYGSNWYGTPSDSTSITDMTAIQQLLGTLRCQGSLTNTKLFKHDDGLLGHNGSYYLTLTFKDSRRQFEYLVINPANDKGNDFFLTRRTSDASSREIGILGWAEMDSEAVREFEGTLKSVSGDQWPFRDRPYFISK